MSEFLTDPSILTKDKLKSALVANNVALPNGDQRKGVYVELYLKNLTSQNKKSSPPDAFSSDEELESMISNKSRSGRKATRKTDRLSPEELDVTDLTDEGLREQLLKYGICVGPIVASTRKVYEKRLQKFLEQGLSDVTSPHPDDHAHSSPLHLDHAHSSPPLLDHAHSVLLHSEHTQTDSSHNGTTYTDQYSDTEGEMSAVPDPEPAPVVERPVRSRGKPSVTPRTLSSQHRVQEEEEVPEEELQVWAVRRKSSRTPQSLDQTVPASDETDFSELSAAEGLSAPRKRTTLTPVAAPRDPTCLLADKPPELSWSESPGRGVVPGLHAGDGSRKAFLTEELYEKSRLPEKSGSPQHKAPWQRSSKDIKPKCVQWAKRRSTSTPPSRELVHVMCSLTPHSASPHTLSAMDSSSKPLSLHPLMVSPDLPAEEHPLPVTVSLSKERAGCRGTQSGRWLDDFGSLLSPIPHVHGQGCSSEEQDSGVRIEKLSYVEQTPKMAERNVLKEMFPNESLSTPTAISVSCRPPIKGAAGRPFPDAWLDDLRPRLTELRQTSASYTESRSAPPMAATPFPASRPTAPPVVQATARRRIPVWVRLLLLSAVAAFLLLVYQAMETNEMGPFGQRANSALHSTSK